MNKQNADIPKPEILAPAGNRASFLAAVAAQADAIYCGLKSFSARMQAKNFTMEEFAALVHLAHEQGIKVFVTINSLLKSDDLLRAGQMLDQLQHLVKPDAVIVQDLAMVPLVKQTGFSGEIHLSTLANAGFSAALSVIRQKLGVDRVVLPRELNIDEIKHLAAACPAGLGLEVFIHGALCYAVSGRCYWSSYMGGKSGLRGRCVQPCRRQYSQSNQKNRYFSCQDFSVDVLAKVLLSIPRVGTWKIEGRKKGPHYVYYTVSAYRMLRDHGHDAKMKKNALELLARALGRSGTHYNFLPQRPQNPVNLSGQTGSGLLVGRIKGSGQKPYFITREELLAGDVLRLGYEDEAGHTIKRIGRSVPKGGRLDVSFASKKALAKGAPVFLTDRREKALVDMISDLETTLDKKPGSRNRESSFQPRLPTASLKEGRVVDLSVHRQAVDSVPRDGIGIWLSMQPVKEISAKMKAPVWWWLPPVVWPENENEIRTRVETAINKGARHFVLNAPWQVAFFNKQKGLHLWAGPFCNLANPLAIAVAESLGLSGVIVSPELGREDYLQLPRHSPLPLGIVIAGSWPLCVARSLAEEVKPNKAFSSPRGEQAWVAKYDTDYWVFPNWKMDLISQKELLQNAGYKLFIELVEPIPKTVKLKNRKGLWNWDISLE
ncbi:U32 family peptidase [Thermodesulfobacteriota bacterium]